MSLIVKSVYPEKQYFGGALEFDPFGIPLLASLRSMSVIIQEKQLHFYGAKKTPASTRVKREIRELFYPSAGNRLETTLADALRAFEGILQAEGYLYNVC